MICLLCSNQLPFHPIVDNGLKFCCHGCKAVFVILSAKKQTENYQENPLFKQALRSGLISNPKLLEQIQSQEEKNQSLEKQKICFEITDLWCPSCAEVISLVCRQEKGVSSCLVDYATDIAFIEFYPQRLSKETIFGLIKNLGYTARSIDQQLNKDGSANSSLNLRFIVASFFALNAMMFAYPLYATYFDSDMQSYGLLFAWLSFASTIPVMTYSAWPIFKRFFSALSVGIFGMEALVFMGAMTAFIFSTYELFHGRTDVYFDSMSVIIAFVLLGKIIENKAKFSARSSLFRLNLSLPKKIRKIDLQSGETSFIAVKDLIVGDTIEVRMGETIASDGLVITGEGVCNEAVMTGEAMPCFKMPGDKLVSGSLLQQGVLVVKVTSTCDHSLLHRIIEMIEKDIGKKSSYIRKADLLVRWFVPLTLAIASLSAALALLLGLGGNIAIYRAMSVLLISCPCALGIAVPLAEACLITNMAKRGVIVRNRGALHILGNEDVIVFDKTGTVTEGKFTVLNGLEPLTPSEQSILFALVRKSNHPISVAIAESLKVQPVAFDKIEEISGNGVSGVGPEGSYYLGSAKYLKSQGLNVPIEGGVELAAATRVYFGKKEGSVYAIELGDRLKPNAKESIQALKAIKTVLLSGDSASCVLHVAKECGFESYLAEKSPLEKHQYIEELKNSGLTVCMVGDGINDSPALTAAHIGISTVKATEISIQVSDLLLTTDRLEVIDEIRLLAKKGQRIMRQNLFWAFIYNVIGMGLAFFGFLSPIFAAFAMVASSLIVLFNAKRL